KYHAIGWSGNGTIPISYETSPSSPTSPTTGLAPGEAFIRRIDTTSVITTLYGNTYDSDNNAVDFIDFPSIPFTPRTTADPRNFLSGTPAAGAIASVLDGLSVPSSATLQ